MKIVFEEKIKPGEKLTHCRWAKQSGDEFACEEGKKYLTIGVNEPEKVNRRQFIILCRKIIALARQNKHLHIAIDLSLWNFPQLELSDDQKAKLMATEFEMANYQFIKFKKAPSAGWNFVEKIVIHGLVNAEVKEAFHRGQMIGRAVNLSRDLSNTPGGSITPEILAKEVKILTQKSKIKVTIFDDKKIASMGMGGLTGVGQGSDDKPRFIVMEYNGTKNNEKPIVLVGKAITFDTGGINLKPSDGLKDMHMDMAGGAAVIASILLAEQIKVKKRIIALIPTAENKVSGSSFRPGDIIKMHSGQTVEVNNTDAEGRLILADALSYARKYKPSLVIDLATLTGAAWVALGNRASAVFTRDETLQGLFRKVGEHAGDYLWPLPLWDEYEEEIQGTFADLDNVGKFGRVGGAITAAMFLFQFAKDYPWVHIDIAPRMTTFEGEYLAKGAYGTGVRLLAALFEESF